MGARTSSSHRFQVLVVAEAADSRDALGNVVREFGHDAIACPPGGQVRQHLQRHAVDLVLLGHSAPDLARDLPGLPPDRWLPVVFMSEPMPGEPGLPATAREMLRAGLDRFGQMHAQVARPSPAEARHREVLNNILDPVLTLDEQERIVDANLAACRTFATGASGELAGRPIEEVTGQGLEVLLRPGLVELHQSDGVRYPAEVSVSGWHEGTVARTTLVLRNFGERLRLERMRDEFLATVSHELRTPLTSVLGAVGLLASGSFGTLPAPAATLLGVAQRNGERLSKLIDDILDLTKLEGDRMVMHLRAQPLRPLVQEAVLANEAYAARSGVVLQCEFAPDVAEVQPRVRVDADRFQQVMANLLSNAIKHSPHGATVAVQVRVQGFGCTVRVVDSGPGIDPQFRSHLFEKFSQADASDGRLLGGTGLGLYLSRLMVERMGGSIDLAAGGQEGAAFELRFPCLPGPGPQYPSGAP